MKRIIISLLALLVAAVSTQAKSWKIGPASVNGMDFASINAAMNSSSVSAGDTLYLDQYYNEAAEQTVNKQVVIIGTGYDTSLTDEKVVARLTSNINLKADNVVLLGIMLYTINLYNTNCIINRCYANTITVSSTTAGMNHIYSCYLYKSGETTGIIVGQSSKSMLDIQNCVIYHHWNTSKSSTKIDNTIVNLRASIIKNNVVYRFVDNNHSNSSNSSAYYALYGIVNSQISNNFIFGYCKYYNDGTYTTYNKDLASSIYASGSGNTIEHNLLSHDAALTYYPTNKINCTTLSNIFTCSGYFSNYFTLKSGSPGIGYANDGGDIGCHGGMFGNPAGGRPQNIPYFTKVVVGSRTENGKLPVSLTVRIQDK